MKRMLLAFILIILACAPIHIAPTVVSSPTTLPTLEYTPTPIPPSRTPIPAHTRTATPYPDEIMDQHGLPMHLVPGGDFVMGSDRGLPNAQPAHTVRVDTFYMDMFEVANIFYNECVEAGACQAPKNVEYFEKTKYAFYPVVYVDWSMAETYCKWRGGRLPTEAEWEKAARGTDERTYPWGENVNCRYANYMYYHDDPFYMFCVDDLSSVGYSEAGKSAYNIYDMAGNATEWVSSLYLPYPYEPTDGREDPNSPGERVVRGGSWSSSSTEIHSYRRFAMSPADSSDRLGFRCVINPDSLPGAPQLQSMIP
ncbi:MAG: formylglycine-generating enzyme family protein [Chloroflexota bacterium]